MAPVIWGLDLKEITWDKFGNKNMWSTRYHLRRTKFVVYQLAMIFCVVSESLGTAALTDYLDQSEWIHHLNNDALEYNQDYVGIGSYNIFAGVFVAFVFGSAFFFDLIWPERFESKGVRLAWRICSVLAVLFEGGAAFALTIITATGSASVSGVGADEAVSLLKQAKYSPLEYKKNARAIAACVFIWPGWLCVIASCIILWMSMANEDQHGSRLAAHVRNTKGSGELNTPESGNAGVELEKQGIVGGAEGPAQSIPAHTQGINEQPGSARIGPSFEEDATAAIKDVRRGHDGLNPTDVVGSPPELAGRPIAQNAPVELASEPVGSSAMTHHGAADTNRL